MSNPGSAQANMEATTDQQESITVNVRGQDGDRLYFKVRRNIHLSKLLTEYCKRKQVEYKVMQFFYNGNRINGRQTPEKLMMKDGDDIDAMMQQNGGSCGTTNTAT